MNRLWNGMIYTADCNALYARALAEGAVSVGEPADQTLGTRMGGILDPFGYTWWIAMHQRDMTREELQRTA